MDKVTIRLASHDDIASIREMARRIWIPSYSSIISPEQIEYMLDLMYSEKSLTHQLEVELCAFYILSEGNIDLGFASVSSKTPELFRLNKLYVDTTFHGRGLGKNLLKCIESHVRDAKGEILELNVNKNNPAVKFYLTQGFEVFREEIIDIGNGFVMDDYVMRKDITL
jgi:ribosomal protein S18 acetylase RimI-like enzyme